MAFMHFLGRKRLHAAGSVFQISSSRSMFILSIIEIVSQGAQVDI